MKKLLTFGLLGLTALGVCGFTNTSHNSTPTHKLKSGVDHNVLNGYSINAMVANPDGGFIIAGDNGLVSEVDSSGVQTKTPIWFPTSLPQYALANIQHNGGFIVAGQNGQIARFDKDLKVSDSMLIWDSGNSYIKQVAVDSSTNNGGMNWNNAAMFLTDSGNIYYTCNVNADLQTNIVDWSDYIGGGFTSIASDGDGAGFIVGKNDGSVDKIDDAGQVTKFISTSNTNGVSSIASDGNGGYLISGGQYAEHFNAAGQALNSLKLTDSTDNNQNSTIISDGNGGAYLTDGVHRIIVDHLDANLNITDEYAPFYPEPISNIEDARVLSIVEDGSGHFIAGGNEGYDSAN